MWIRLATFILRYRFPVLAFVVLVTAFMASQAPKVQMSYKFGGILPKTDSTQIDYQNFLDQFSEDGNIIVLGIEDTGIYKLANFQAWYDLGNDLRQIDGVDSIFSEAHLVRLVKDTTSRSFVLERFFKNRPESQSEVDSIIAQQRTYPFYRSLLYNDTTHASLMMVFVDADVFNTEDRGKVVDALHEKTRAFEAAHLNIHYSGLPYIRTINAERVKAELGLFVGLAAAVTALIIFLFYRSFKVLVISILVVGIGVVWSMGTIALFDYKLSLLMALIPPLIIVIGIPNCVFLITKYHQEFRKHGNRMKALARVVQRIGNATFMTNLTTALGFATFIFTSSPMLREFGVIASINVLNVFVLSLLIVPTLFSLLPEPKTRHTRHLDRTWVTGVVQWLVRVVQHQRRAIYIITAIVVVLGIYGITLIKTSGRIVDDLPQGDYILDDLLFFERNFNGIMPLEVLITADKPGQITSDKNLRKIERLQDSLEAYVEISRSLSIVDAIKYGRQAFYNGVESRYALLRPNEKTFIALYIQGGRDGKGAEMAQMFVDSTQTTARISANIADIGTEQLAVLMTQIQPQVDSLFPEQEYDVVLTGTSIVFLKGTNYLVNNLIVSLILAIIMISIVMAVLFSSVRMVAISLVPNLIPLLVTGAIMGYFGVPLKPSTILVFSIAFGISVDDTIHYLAKFRQELILHPYDLRKAILNAVRDTGISMMYTSIILFFGFSIFTISDFGGTIALGVLVSITLLVAMLSNLVLLPSLLMSLQRRATTRAFEAEPLIQVIDEEEDIDLNELTLQNANPGKEASKTS